MYPHRINLSAAWEGPAGRVNLPVAGRGVARLRRSFGPPRQLDVYERAWIECAATGVRWTLNGEKLGGLAADVTRLLKGRNELVADCDGEWSLGAAALVVRCSAYLQDVTLANGQVQGRVAGTADGPLELYLMVNAAHAGYCTIAAGETFAFPVTGEGEVRVELINVSAVWDTVQIP